MSKTTLIFSLFFLSFGLKTGWETNLDLAKEKAVKEEKYILLNFSGSDWCGSCIKLDRELFETIKNTF